MSIRIAIIIHLVHVLYNDEHQHLYQHTKHNYEIQNTNQYHIIQLCQTTRSSNKPIKVIIQINISTNVHTNNFTMFFIIRRYSG